MIDSHEKKQQKMEEERTDALEMAEKETQERKKEAKIKEKQIILVWEADNSNHF